MLRESFHKKECPALIMKDESNSSTSSQHIQSMIHQEQGQVPLPAPGTSAYFKPLSTLALRAHKPRSKPSTVDAQMAD